VSSPPPLTLSLSFADSIIVLMAACGIAPDARGPFEARIRHLQRLGVPDRAGDPMRRLHYGIAELASFATTVRLIDAFMAPALAVRYVSERWSDLAPLVLAGASEALPPGYLVRRSIPLESFAVFRANALTALGKRGGEAERSDETLGRIRICDGARAETIIEALGGAGLVLDSRTYMPVIVREWSKRLSATDTEIGIELDRLRFTK
jgi:hypothetical protein